MAKIAEKTKGSVHRLFTMNLEKFLPVDELIFAFRGSSRNERRQHVSPSFWNLEPFYQEDQIEWGLSAATFADAAPTRAMFTTAHRVTNVAPFRIAPGAPRRARRGAVAVRAEASGSSYYKVVNGVKLDRKVIDDATEFQANNGTIDKDEAQRIFLDIVDGPKRAVGGANETMTTVTNVELDTAQYIYDNFEWEEDAKEWFYNELTSKNW